MNISIINKFKNIARKSILSSLPLGGVGGGLLFVALTGGLTSCSDTDINPNVTSAICPSTVTMVVPTDMEQYIYTDATGTKVLPLIKGQTVTLGCTLAPENITFSDVAWSSSSPTVATVDNGKVEAVSSKGLGYSVITVVPEGMYSGSGVTDALKVTVDDQLIPATGVVLTPNATEVYEGETVNVASEIQPENTTYKTLKWTSSDESVATVDKNGVVTGVKVHSGTLQTPVTITATALDGSNASASVVINVKTIVPPTAITLDTKYAAGNYDCAVGDKSITLSYTTVPAECTTSLIEWSSSDESIATVKDGVVTFNQNGNFGEFTITAKCPNGASSSIKMNLPAGLIRETYMNENNIGWYVASQSGNGTKTSYKWSEGMLTISTYKQNDTKQRGDFKCWATPIYLHAGNYPIIAVKMDDLLDLDWISARNINCDCVGVGVSSGASYKALGNGNNKWTSRLKCSDGSYVFIYDMSKTSFGTGGLAPTNEAIKFTTFQWKYADIAAKSAAQNVTLDYRVFWVQTFKSVDEIKAKLDKAGISYE